VSRELLEEIKEEIQELLIKARRLEKMIEREERRRRPESHLTP